MTTQYDPLFRSAVKTQFPELETDIPFGWLWIKAQAIRESGLNPLAVSDKGAQGLMQILPGTWKEITGGKGDPFNAADSITAGVIYLADLYRDFAEIPNHRERLKMALASYNGGKGYINMALALARKDEGLPTGFQAWIKAGRLPGIWQTWDVASYRLASPACIVKGKRPGWRQIINYVKHIEAGAGKLISSHPKGGTYGGTYTV